MLKAIKHCKWRVCCKYHFHRYRRLVKSHDNLNSEPLWHPSHAHCWLSVARHHSVPSVVAYNNRMLGCKKKQSGLLSSLFGLDELFLLFVSAGIHAHHFTEEKYNNNHNLVDCWFFFSFLRQSSLPWMSLLSQTSISSISSMRLCKSPCIGIR
jgi:hypothetical protein